MASLLQFHQPGAAPDLAEVLAVFGLQRADVDGDFGVVATDPAGGLYVVRVKDHALGKVSAALARRPRHPAEGLFGDPRVEPFGPPA